MILFILILNVRFTVSIIHHWNTPESKQSLPLKLLGAPWRPVSSYYLKSRVKSRGIIETLVKPFTALRVQTSSETC